jgi:uncharacterized protein YdeI (YjbR/CyaY-like superfamily)
MAGREVITCRDPAEWEAWLAEHHATSAEVWLRIAKKGSGIASVTPSEALDGALCWGWIDSQRAAGDAASYLQRYSPRRPGSRWSQVNVDRVEALTAAGRLAEPGRAQVAAAQADGRWAAAYAPQRTATAPADLTAALRRYPPAAERFAAMDRSRRYAVLLRLATARTPEQRAARLAAAVEALC